jgi:hypothetical protein
MTLASGILRGSVLGIVATDQKLWHGVLDIARGHAASDKGHASSRWLHRDTSS